MYKYTNLRERDFLGDLNFKIWLRIGKRVGCCEHGNERTDSIDGE
jgi:hypothetical protein